MCVKPEFSFSTFFCCCCCSIVYVEKVLVVQNKQLDFLYVMLVKLFNCRTAFGIRDGHGDEQQTIRKKPRYGNPTDNFGQPANGGLTNIDQRQLNRIYCESVRHRVVQDELTQTLRHTIQEYPALTVAEFGPKVSEKFDKIYPRFFYIVHVWHSGFQQAAVSHNGHCVTVTNQGKRHVILCYKQRDSLEWPRGPIDQIQSAVEARLRAIGVSMFYVFHLSLNLFNINFLFV